MFYIEDHKVYPISSDTKNSRINSFVNVNVMYITILKA